MEKGIPVNMGSNFLKIEVEPYPLISHLFINPVDTNFPEFIGIYNPSGKLANLSNYSISKGFTYTFPEGTLLGPSETLYLTSDAGSFAWYNFSSKVLEWTSGQLSNNGEAIELMENNGLIIDYLNYDDQGIWPVEAFSSGKLMVLKNHSLDNHFGENWIAESIENVFNPIQIEKSGKLVVFPNPTKGKINVIDQANRDKDVYIYSVQGNLLGTYSLNSIKENTVDLSVYNEGVVILRIGDQIRKVVILK
jgi:hypothetical protein